MSISIRPQIFQICTESIFEENISPEKFIGKRSMLLLKWSDLCSAKIFLHYNNTNNTNIDMTIMVMFMLVMMAAVAIKTIIAVSIVTPMIINKIDNTNNFDLIVTAEIYSNLYHILFWQSVDLTPCWAYSSMFCSTHYPTCSCRSERDLSFIL